MDIDLDTLQARWMAQEARMSEVLRVSARTLHLLGRSQAQTALHRFRRTLWAQIAVNAIAAIVLGLFISRNYQNPRFLAPGIALDVFVIFALSTAARQLVMLARIDHDGPVTDMQRRLERLRAFRIRVTITIVLSAMMLWVPVYIVLIKELFGMSVYDWLPDWFFVLNIGVGVILVPIALWASRRFANTLGRHPVVQRLARDLAGASLNAASARLKTLAAFEQEDEGA